MSSFPVFDVETPGLLTAIYDLGRFGFRRFGLPVGGAMDSRAASLVNLLVGNGSNDAVLEVTFAGPRLRALRPCVCALGGADLSATLDGESLPLWRSFSVSEGQILTFGRRRTGARAYLAVSGGFDFPVVLGSRSTFARAGIGRALRMGDTLFSGDFDGVSGRRPVTIPEYSSRLRVTLGPSDDCFSPVSVAEFLASTYVVTPNLDRMGCRLSGPPIVPLRGVLTDAAAFGVVQIPPDGSPILLLADCQTTGGYPKIATVISVDLPNLAQLWIGDVVTFEKITLEDARKLAVARERELSVWSAARRGGKASSK